MCCVWFGLRLNGRPHSALEAKDGNKAKSLGHVFAAISGTQRVPGLAAASARIAAAAMPAGSAKLQVVWASKDLAIVIPALSLTC